jgi:hypothetical protein
MLLAAMFPMLPTPASAAVASIMSPAETTGSIQVKLHPTEGVSTGVSKLVTFGVPFPRGSVTAANLNKIRVLKNGVEIAAYVEQQTPWRHISNTSLDGQSVRVARIQINNTFTVSYPNYETITVEWGSTARTLNISTFVNPRTAWHQVTTGSFVSADNVYEPDVYAVFPPTHLTKSGISLSQMNPLDSSVTSTRSNPTTMDATEHWPGYTEAEHAFKNNFFTTINEDDPLVTVANQNKYKTTDEPWLYDRSSTMFMLYLRSGSFKALREAVRSTDFYKTKLYDASTLPTRAIGLFKLKNPDPNGWPGGNGAMYSYNEPLAYTHWLTGDNDALTYIPLVVQAHETNDEPTRWAAGLGTWTERHTAFRLLANIVAYEVLGTSSYKANIVSQTGDFIWHQNGAGGLLPSGRVDGGLYHYGSQHGDGVAGDLVASSWMTVLTVDAMVRAYALSDDTSIGSFIKRTGNFLKTASKSDPYHMYDTYTGTLRYPDYMMKYDGTTDASDGERGSAGNPTGGTTIEHNLDVANAILWAEYFNQLGGGSPDASLKTAATDLYAGYDIGVNFWIRPGGPAAGNSAFRVNPWRKWGWEHRATGSFSWLAGQVLSGGGSTDTVAPTVSMTPPTGGSTVSGVITLSANASDNVAVAGVQFQADGSNIGTEDTVSPYSISFDTTTLSNGTHTFRAVARDTSGNTTTSAAVSVTINNASTPVTVTFQQGVNSYSGTKDVFITSQGGGNGSRDTTGDMKVFDQTQQATPYEIRSLIRFDGITIPAGKTVTSAKLTLRFDTWKAGFTLEGRYLNTAWNPTYASLGWLNRDTSLLWNTAGIKGSGTDFLSSPTFTVTGFTATGVQTKQFALSPSVVQGWITTPSTNYGILLFINNPNTAMNISSSENSTVSYRPILEITYQ